MIDLPPRRWVDVAGHRGSFVEAGEGPPVVLLASMVVLAESYRTSLAALRRRFRVVVAESPGCGRGSRLSEPWGISDYADWVADFLDLLRLDRGIECPTLIGHSNSGAVALTVAAQYPGRVSRIVLADTVGVDERCSILRVLASRAVDAVIEWPLTAAAWHHPVYNAIFHTRNCLRQVRWAGQTDLTPLGPDVRVPTLLAWGARDHTTPLRGAHRLHRLLRDGTLYVSPTGCHDWVVDHPREFTDALAEFVRRTPTAGHDAARHLPAPPRTGIKHPA